MNSVTTTLAPEQQQDRHPAYDYIAQLSSAIASGSDYILALSRLKVELTDAIQDYETACQSNESFEICLDKQSHMLWLCNQCDYYLTMSSPAFAKQRNHRGLWQIRAVVLAMIRFKLITHIRSLFPGPKSISLPWSDLRPGIWIWVTGCLYR